LGDQLGCRKSGGAAEVIHDLGAGQPRQQPLDRVGLREERRLTHVEPATDDAVHVRPFRCRHEAGAEPGTPPHCHAVIGNTGQWALRRYAAVSSSAG